jgi:hypothetical protein
VCSEHAWNKSRSALCNQLSLYAATTCESKLNAVTDRIMQHSAPAQIQHVCRKLKSTCVHSSKSIAELLKQSVKARYDNVSFDNFSLKQLTVKYCKQQKCCSPIATCYGLSQRPHLRSSVKRTVFCAPLHSALEVNHGETKVDRGQMCSRTQCVSGLSWSARKGQRESDRC